MRMMKHFGRLSFYSKGLQGRRKKKTELFREHYRSLRRSLVFIPLFKPFILPVKMMSIQFAVVIVVLSLITQSSAFNALKVRTFIPTKSLTMKVENDAFAKANRSQRRAAADDRIVELRMPMGMDLDEDKNGNVFVKSIEKGGRAEKSGMIFVGDIVAMVSATFGDDMWSARGVGLDRVVSNNGITSCMHFK
jgi:hypothetical protein